MLLFQKGDNHLQGLKTNFRINFSLGLVNIRFKRTAASVLVVLLMTIVRYRKISDFCYRFLISRLADS